MWNKLYKFSELHLMHRLISGHLNFQFKWNRYCWGLEDQGQGDSEYEMSCMWTMCVFRSVWASPKKQVMLSNSVFSLGSHQINV